MRKLTGAAFFSIALAAVVLLLAACGGGDGKQTGEEATPSPVATAEPTKEAEADRKSAV